MSRRSILPLSFILLGVVVTWLPSCGSNSSPASPVATDTPTFTSTLAGSPTNTPTITDTLTITSTSTNTATATMTTTPSHTPTFTATGTPTATATNSFTDTPTGTPTNSATNSATDSPTPTGTFTFTDTSTPSPTDSATSTSTGTPTLTFTSTPTGTPTNTPTITDTPTITFTPTITNTAVYPFQRFIGSPDSFNFIALRGSGPLTIYGTGLYTQNNFIMTGTDTGSWSSASTVTLPGGIEEGIAVNSAGTSVYFTSLNGGLPTFLGRADMSLSLATTWAAGFSTPEGLAMDSSDNIYVAGANTNLIYKFNSAGVSLTSWGGYNQPYGVAVDTARSLVYVASHLGGTILKSALDGSSQGVFATLPTVFNPPTPYGLAVDASGDVFVTDNANAYWYKYDPSGTLLASIYVGALTAPTGSYPSGIAVDSTGYVYVSDLSLQHLVEFAPY